MIAPGRRFESLPASLEDARLRNLPPQNLHAEQAILGGVLRKTSLLDKLGVELWASDFYSPAHRLIWEAMLGLWRASKPVDLITLAGALTAAGRLDAIGGPAYLGELAGSTLSPANSPHYADIVRAMAKRRAMLDMAMRMMDIAYDPERDPSEFVGIAQLAADAVLKDRLDAHGESPAEFLDPYTHYLERLEESGGGGVATPFWKLNALIRSFMPGEMIVIGARPSHGKTALALTLAEHAVGLGHPTGIFSLEMAKYQLLNRIFSSGKAVGFRIGQKPQAGVVRTAHLHAFARVAPGEEGFPMKNDPGAEVADAPGQGEALHDRGRGKVFPGHGFDHGFDVGPCELAQGNIAQKRQQMVFEPGQVFGPARFVAARPGKVVVKGGQAEGHGDDAVDTLLLLGAQPALAVGFPDFGQGLGTCAGGLRLFDVGQQGGGLFRGPAFGGPAKSFLALPAVAIGADGEVAVWRRPIFSGTMLPIADPGIRGFAPLPAGWHGPGIVPARNSVNAPRRAMLFNDYQVILNNYVTSIQGRPDPFSRLNGLKIHRSQGLASSSLAPGTRIIPAGYARECLEAKPAVYFLPKCSPGIAPARFLPDPIARLSPRAPRQCDALTRCHQSAPDRPIGRGSFPAAGDAPCGQRHRCRRGLPAHRSGQGTRDRVEGGMGNRSFPLVLGGVFVAFFTALAVSPASRPVWWAENIPVMAMFVLLVATFHRFRYTNLAYAMMAVWLFLHTIGGHYTFANVPFGFVTDLFGFSRNHFDRIAHFSVGFYAFALAELLTRKRLAHPVVVVLFGLTAIMAVACAYEIIEWGYAVVEGGEAGVEFLGSQGDPWDAQKDMLADTLGAVFALAVFVLRQCLASGEAAGRASTAA